MALSRARRYAASIARRSDRNGRPVVSAAARGGVGLPHRAYAAIDKLFPAKDIAKLVKNLYHEKGGPQKVYEYVKAVKSEEEANELRRTAGFFASATASATAAAPPASGSHDLTYTFASAGEAAEFVEQCKEMGLRAGANGKRAKVLRPGPRAADVSDLARREYGGRPEAAPTMSAGIGGDTLEKKLAALRAGPQTPEVKKRIAALERQQLLNENTRKGLGASTSSGSFKFLNAAQAREFKKKCDAAKIPVSWDGASKVTVKGQNEGQLRQARGFARAINPDSVSASATMSASSRAARYAARRTPATAAADKPSPLSLTVDCASPQLARQLASRLMALDGSKVTLEDAQVKASYSPEHSSSVFKIAASVHRSGVAASMTFACAADSGTASASASFSSPQLAKQAIAQVPKSVRGTESDHSQTATVEFFTNDMVPSVSAWFKQVVTACKRVDPKARVVQGEMDE